MERELDSICECVSAFAAEPDERAHIEKAMQHARNARAMANRWAPRALEPIAVIVADLERL